ncbi:MAG: hypothetical protein K0R71_2076 [Bacillales bacterium]|jgi:hypothetical protein|nr:hypothetical protein [Bacillales bacterium]
MQEIDVQIVQEYIDSKMNQELYIHLETTNGAYASHHENKFGSGAFIRNTKIVYSNGKITPDHPHRVGLEMEIGWIYAEGLTHYQIDDQGRLLMCGIDYDGKLAVALQLSDTPFSK